MKVGVCLRLTTPQEGGGYTFEDDIFQSLVELASESKHSFAILTHKEHARLDNNSLANFQLINLKSLRSKQFNKRLSTKLARVYNRVSSRIPGIPRLGLGKLDWVEEVVQDAGLDVIWNVTPFDGIYPSNIPFISIVWDLQHRLQPWFPEVSSHGGWKSREQHFSHLKRASFIITGTEAGKSEIASFYQIPSERIKLNPHPTPQFALNGKLSHPEANGKRVLEQYGIPTGYLFYPAQFWSHKNHVSLLFALDLLRDKYGLVFPLVFVGSDHGNERYVRKVVGQLNLTNQVHFLGFVPQEDLIFLYRNAFALTYVSFFGPENLPPLEAFALECPVIASNVPGAEEQLGDSALLVDPKDKTKIANAIKSLHDDPALRQKLVALGRPRASKWTSEDFVKTIFSLLDEFEPIRNCWR